MSGSEKPRRKSIPKDQSRVPAHSVFYQKIIPVLLGGMAVLTVVLILVAAAVLLGVVRF